MTYTSDSIKSDFIIDETKILEVFQKYGVTSERPINLKEFVRDIDKHIYNRVYWNVTETQ
jgi:hypothetical protein